MSAETGSGGIQIAENLCACLQAHSLPGKQPWRVIAREELMAKVLEEHQLPARLASVLPEDACNPVDDVMYELLGLHPPSWILAQHTMETIRSLAQKGNLVLVGWGVNAITQDLPNVLHVRVVGSLEKRLRRIESRQHLDRKQALALIEHSDLGRARYMKRYFHQHVSDVHLYDLIINTDHLPEPDVARLIADALLSRSQASSPHPALPTNSRSETPTLAGA